MRHQRNNVSADAVAQRAVRTRLSGSLLSLPSEGTTDLEDVVVLSNRLLNALAQWALLSVPSLTPDNVAEVERELAHEAIRLFGIPDEHAAQYAAARVRAHLPA